MYEFVLDKRQDGYELHIYKDNMVSITFTQLTFSELMELKKLIEGDINGV